LIYSTLQSIDHWILNLHIQQFQRVHPYLPNSISCSEDQIEDSLLFAVVHVMCILWDSEFGCLSTNSEYVRFKMDVDVSAFLVAGCVRVISNCWLII